VIVSVHVASLGRRAALNALRRPPQPGDVPGLRYAETAITAPLGSGSLAPRPRFDRIGLIAAWDDDGALDAFSGRHPLGALLGDAGWMIRLAPLRVSGAWPEMPGLPSSALPVDDEEPVAVLTLGRLRLHRALPFLRSAAPAESEVATEPGLLASAGLARPPHLVSTFSVWRTAAAMRDYSYRKQGAHQAAVRADRARPFHRQSAFIRFRPYASRGSWDGHDPLADLLPAAA
jgi:heme-degrading monooxygenase HmoA